MPTEGLSIVSEKQKEKITEKINSLHEYHNTESLYEEVQEEYWKSMNSIILKKHLNESRFDLVPC